MNLSLSHLKRGDFFIFITLFSFTLILTLLFFARRGGDEPSLAYIQTPTEEYYFPLDTPLLFSVNGTIGVTELEIEGGSLSFLRSPCRDKLCIQHAPIRLTQEWNACLPNGIFAKIISRRPSGVTRGGIDGTTR